MKRVGSTVDVQASNDGLARGGGRDDRAGGRPEPLHLVSFFLLHNPPQDSGSPDFPRHHWWRPQHAGDLGFLPPGPLPAPPWTPNPPLQGQVQPQLLLLSPPPVQALTVFPSKGCHTSVLILQPCGLFISHFATPVGRFLLPFPR